MTPNAPTEPRCDRCDHVLLRAGSVCHVCDVEQHFEGVLRTAPALITPQRDEARPLQSAHPAS